MPDAVFLHTRFPRSSAVTDGGVRRTHQLLELLERSGHRVVNERRSELDPRDPVEAGVSRLPGFFRKRLRRALFARRLGAFREPGAVLWDDTWSQFVPEVAHRQGRRVIAAPHNLEQLLARRLDLARLRQELRALARADAVFCISREETWLLRSLGIPASCLPYFPPEPVYRDLVAVRARRGERPRGTRWLMVGTAANPPTRRGMTEALAWLAEVQAELPLELDVVGYGTEKLDAGPLPPGFRVHGGVSFEVLQELFAACRGVIVHHFPTGGALTRLVECAVAGVPVLANADATKGQPSPGVTTYRDRAELRAALAGDLPTPALPERPAHEERRFVEAFREQP